MNLNRKPKIGLLLIGAERFQSLGEGTADGTYKERKAVETGKILSGMKEYADVVFTEPVYTREAAEKAVALFFNEKVDGVVASFLSWAEDFAWIRFLRELPPMPLLLASFVRDSLSITDTNDENQFLDFLSAGALVGFQEASGSFRRFDRPMSEIFIGTFDQVMAKTRVFAAAAKTRAHRYFLLDIYFNSVTNAYLFKKQLRRDICYIASVCRKIRKVCKNRYFAAVRFFYRNIVIKTHRLHY